MLLLPSSMLSPPMAWSLLHSGQWLLGMSCFREGMVFPMHLAARCKSSEVLQCPGSIKEAGRAEETTRGGLGAQLGGPFSDPGLLI